MKRQIKETTILGKRGQQRVITYGYDTGIDGLDVVRTTDRNTKEFTPIHTKSGFSLSVYFISAIRAVRFANKYLKGFDFTQDIDKLLNNKKLRKCVIDAKEMEMS